MKGGTVDLSGLARAAGRRLAIIRHAQEVTGNVALTARYFERSPERTPGGNGTTRGKPPNHSALAIPASRTHSRCLIRRQAQSSMTLGPPAPGEGGDGFAGALANHRAIAFPTSTGGTETVRDRTPDWTALQASIAGDVILPGSTAYDDLPRTFNARYHDVVPIAVVRCATPEDVRETLTFVSRHGLASATRAGGHCFAGRSSTRGVVIDVSPMRSVSVSSGVVTVGAGATSGMVYEALREHGLAIPAGTCPSVGVAGVTLGGGLGILGRTHGVTSDHLRAAQIVVADGRILDVDDDQHEDLFWALRGAGAGNFGVVTSLVLGTVPAPDVTNVHVSWPFSHAADVIQAWQAWAPDAPDELAASLKLTEPGGDEPAPVVDVYAALQGQSPRRPTSSTSWSSGPARIPRRRPSERCLSRRPGRSGPTSGRRRAVADPRRAWSTLIWSRDPSSSAATYPPR